MERYTGQPLPSAPRIALMANDALGNFVASTPLAQALRHFHPGCRIDFYGGERTAELEIACTAPSSPAADPIAAEAEHGALLFSWRTSVHGVPFAQAAQTALERCEQIGGYDLVINLEAGHANRALAALVGEGAFVCGPCLRLDSRGEWEHPNDERGDLWRDKCWIAPDITQRYPFLQTGFICEIFIRLAYLEPIPAAPWPGGIPRYRLPAEAPGGSIPEVLISTGGTLPEKLWPLSEWRALLRLLGRNGLSAGLLGAPPKRQREFYLSEDDEQKLVEDGLAEDLRGKLSLPQVVGALTKAQLLITIDNGILHFAAANERPTVGLYRPGFDRLWAPPNPNLVRVLPKEGNVERIEAAAVLEAAESLLR